MIAANIMTTDVLTFTPNNTLLDAVRLAGKNAVRQIPVVDGENKVLGVITPGIVLKVLLAGSSPQDSAKGPNGPKGLLDYFEGLAAQTVEGLMDKGFLSVMPETRASEIAVLFADSKTPVDSILVVDDHKRLLGMISPPDVFKRLWEYLEKKKTAL